MAGDRVWRKSSYSGATEGGECVEVAFGHDVLVRDSKNADAGTLSFSAPAWRAFVQRQP
ncbi:MULTISPECIES: DUF397 domain-containing protein [unclassified Lentzea]|uniref:DUF397 domain-containing protein n=1 Tax=unclassified Lentzea TaxID=2643253 RepID=UPI00224A8C64|nr:MULTISPECIES: DUF397 domain-containing protein [unclassified Lentzea]MCX2953868.1 DUF397 domain-containing protein [Lentzea sp. NEAU-D7]WUD21148.1 DUF397 domain-containing protein [Lentzea sp. NBC_00516]